MAKKASKPNDFKKRAELMQYAQTTDIGIIDRDRREAIVDEAMDEDDPRTFLDLKAEEITRTLEGAGSDDSGKEVKCPASSRHKNVRRYAIAAKKKRSYVCDDCGATWVQ